uniref:Uncharacterized protein n=1 Tax=Cacopsylla melanoneura TaxID=428564 RepID=A0A8D8YAW4_9HEMI
MGEVPLCAARAISRSRMNGSIWFTIVRCTRRPPTRALTLRRLCSLIIRTGHCARPRITSNPSRAMFAQKRSRRKKTARHTTSGNTWAKPAKNWLRHRCEETLLEKRRSAITVLPASTATNLSFVRFVASSTR